MEHNTIIDVKKSGSNITESLMVSHLSYDVEFLKEQFILLRKNSDVEDDITMDFIQYLENMGFVKLKTKSIHFE